MQLQVLTTNYERYGTQFGQITLRNPMRISIPGRWDSIVTSRDAAKCEIQKCVQCLAIGTEALHGVYMRICDLIRQHSFTDAEVRELLADRFPPPRVSELLRVANAPPETYRRYRCGFVGFRAALAECRGYRINDTEHLKRRKIKRAASRLLSLMGAGQVEVGGHRITIL